MKKRFIVLLYLLILICTCSIGFATWVFTNDHFFGANYAPQAEFNFNDQKATYDGTTHQIKYPSKEVENEIASNYGPQIINPVTNGNVDSTQNVTLHDAGEYNIKFVPLPEKVSTYEEINIHYTIDKRTLGFSYGIKENKAGGKSIPSTTGKDMLFEFNAGSETYLPDVVPNNLIQGDTCTIKYSNMTTPLEIPSNQTYTISSCSNSNYQLPSDKTFSVTIKKLKIHLVLVNNVIELDVDPANPLTWAGAKDLFINQLKFKIKGDVDTNVVNNPFVLSFDYMHNGYYSYGDNRPNKYQTTTNIAGSTYKVKIGEINSDDYILDDLYFVFKYKTVGVTSKDGKTNFGYMTIEDALAHGGSLRLAGDSTSSSSYIITSFSRIDVNNLAVDEGEFTRVLNDVWLHVAFENSNNRYTPGDHTIKNYNTYSALVIPQGITLNVRPGGQILVCGQIGNGGISGTRGVLMNHGVINMEGGMLESYGYTKGTGEINALSSSNVSDVLKMYNYPGGRNSAGMKDIVFPLNVFSFHNISCKLKVDGSSCFTAFYRQEASGVKAEGWASVLGTDTKHNGGRGLFTLSSANQYIVKSVENVKVTDGVAKIDYAFNSSITASNGEKSQREVLEIHGDFTDNPMKVSVGGQEIATSPKIALPIGYMRIHIMKDDTGKAASGTLANNSYKMLPGSEIRIDKGCTLNIAAGTNMVAYDETYKEDYVYINEGVTQNPETAVFSYKAQHTDWFTQTDKSKIGAQIIVNGTLNAQGGFGGKAITEVNLDAIDDKDKATGKLIINKSSGTIQVLNRIEYKKIFVFGSSASAKPYTDNPRLRLFNGSGISDIYQGVNTGTYVAKVVGDQAGWFINGQASIEYETNNGSVIDPRTINITDTGYSLIAEDLPTNLTRTHYTFDGWYFSTNYQPEYKAKVGQTIYAGAVLHAHWIPIEYKIEYVNKDKDGNVLTEGITNTNQTTFNIESTVGLTNPTSANNLVFGGWYSSDNFILDNKVILIDGSTFIDRLVGDTVEIYGEWWPKGTTKFVVDYEALNDEYDPNSYAHQVIVVNTPAEGYTLQTMTMNDNEFGASKFFKGWKLADRPDDEIITKLTAEMVKSGHVALVGVWGTKVGVDVYTAPEGGDPIPTMYIQPGISFTVPKVGKNVSNHEIPPEILYQAGTLTGWLISGGLENGKTHKSGDVIQSLSNTEGEKITMRAQYEMTITINDDRNKYVRVTDPGGKQHTVQWGTTSFKVKYGETIHIEVFDQLDTPTGVEVINGLTNKRDLVINNLTGVFQHVGYGHDTAYRVVANITINCKKTFL